jgi:ATP-binding cassette subfamily C protein
MLNKTSTDLIRYFLRRYPRRSALIVALLILSGLAEGVGVASLLPLLDLAVAGTRGDGSGASASLTSVLGAVGLSPTLGVLLSLIAGGMFLKGVFIWLSVRQQGYAVAGIAKDLRLLLIRAVLRARWSHFISKPAGQLANAIGNEAHRASMAYAAACALLASLVQVLVYAVAAFLVSPAVALAAIVTGGFIILVLGRLVGIARDAGQAQTQLIRSLSARLVDALYGMKPIKAMGREAHLQPLLEEETRELNEAQRRQVLATGVLTSLQEPLLVVVLTLGLYLVLTRGGTSFGALLVLAFLFHRMVTRIQLVQAHVQSMAVSESAFWSLLDGVKTAEAEAEQSGGNAPAPHLESGIELRDVRFSFGEHRVLDGVSMTIPAGTFTTITGPSGAGKTTIADLMIGFYSPDAGAVEVDGVPLAAVQLPSWRQNIGYVPQETLLFHDTILRNVTLGDLAITEGAVEEALQAADAWDFTRSLPEGVHTVVGEHGARLSGGQRQRIAIARALVRKPALLVLDEVTTALDPQTEMEICSTLRNLVGRVTIVSISHQQAMREAADLVYHLERGRVSLVARTENAAGVVT